MTDNNDLVYVGVLTLFLIGGDHCRPDRVFTPRGRICGHPHSKISSAAQPPETRTGIADRAKRTSSRPPALDDEDGAVRLLPGTGSPSVAREISPPASRFQVGGVKGGIAISPGSSCRHLFRGFRISKTEMSDADLIRSARTGDSSAVETLYSRHHDAGLRFARRLMADKADAEDVAQEAFQKVTAAIGRGNGPEVAFRPYLLRAVRTAAADYWERQSKETPTDNIGDAPVEDASLAALLHRDDPELVMKAFQSLPVRWMTVLWHAEVEREPPRRIAPILGLEPGAVSALLLRARKGLREAYLTAYARGPARTDCEPTFPYLAATVLGTSSARDRRKVKEHTRDCEDCAKVLAELTDVGATMRGILAPLLLLPCADFSSTQLPAKTAATKYGAMLAAAAVTIAAVAVGATGAIDFGTQSAASSANAAPSAPSVPTQPPPTYTPTAGASSPEEPAAAENTVTPIQNYPAQLIITGPLDARTAPAGAVRPTRPPAGVLPGDTAVALSPDPVSTSSVTAIVSSVPSPVPSAATSPTPTPAPTTSPTNAPVPTAAPTEPPAEPGCTPILLLCLSLPSP
jgi:RNA polymerase sigma factor (sigma-70 family)